jgi:hypothetical protein
LIPDSRRIGKPPFKFSKKKPGKSGPGESGIRFPSDENSIESIACGGRGSEYTIIGYSAASIMPVFPRAAGMRLRVLFRVRERKQVTQLEAECPEHAQAAAMTRTSINPQCQCRWMDSELGHGAEEMAMRYRPVAASSVRPSSTEGL